MAINPKPISCPNCGIGLSEAEVFRHFDLVFPTGNVEAMTVQRGITLVDEVEDDNEAAEVALALWLVTWRHLKRQFFDEPDLETISLAEMPQLLYSPRGTFIVLDLLRSGEDIARPGDQPGLWLVSDAGGIGPTE